MIKKHIREFIEKTKNLIDSHDPPHAIAGGMAIGMFFGFSPILGFKTLSATGVSLLTRCNIIATIVGVSLNDVLFPIYPIILRYEYDLGFWLLSHPHHLPEKLTHSHFKLSTIMNWHSLFTIGLPLVVGQIIIAIPISILSYFVTLKLIAYYRELKAKKALKKGNI